MPAARRIDPRSIAGQPRELLHRGSRFNPDVFRIEWEGRPAALKDYSSIPPGPARSWGRWMVRRQLELLQRAEGVPGIPAALALAGRSAFLMEWLPGRKVSELQDGAPTPEFFDQLDGLIRLLHARGLSHGDIHRDHVLIDERGCPALIDFELAIMPRRGWRRLLARPLLRLGQATDRFQIARMKQLYHPGKLTSQERALIRRPPWPVRLSLTLRRKWRRI